LIAKKRRATTGATDTGAASDRYWSCEQQILEPLEPPILELRATDTGAANDSHLSLQRQPLQWIDTSHWRGTTARNHWIKYRTDKDRTGAASTVDILGGDIL